MADEDTREKLLREASKLLGELFVGRRDAKAFWANGQWVAVREKFKISDFRNHLFGSKCLGTYLLDPDSMVRFMAFDIDLKDDCSYFVIRDLPQIEAMQAAGEYDGELDPDIREGNLEAALHDPMHEGHRWACNLLASATESVRARVSSVLGLSCTTIITGGGAHVLVPFGELVPAADARAMAHSVMEQCPTFVRRSESFYANAEHRPSLEVEVFPKQDRLKDPGSLGNLLRLPFGMHEVGVRTFAMDPTQDRVPSWEIPRLKSMAALRRQAELVGVSVSV